MTKMFAGWFPSKWNHAFATMLVFGAVLSVSTLARAECTKDTDCKGDRVCTAGACADAVSPIARTLPDDVVPLPPVVQPVPTPAPVAAGTPVAPAQRVQRRAHRDTGMSYGGLGLLAVGVLMGGTGAVMYVSGTQADCSPKSRCDTVWKTGVGFLILGGIATVIGIVYLAIGSSEDSVAVTPKSRLVPYVGLSGGEAEFRF